MKGGRYMPPETPGYSIEMQPSSREDYEFPTGKAWQAMSQAQ
jgi:L-fuconate dehydratase